MSLNGLSTSLKTVHISKLSIFFVNLLLLKKKFKKIVLEKSSIHMNFGMRFVWVASIHMMVLVIITMEFKKSLLLIFGKNLKQFIHIYAGITSNHFFSPNLPLFIFIKKYDIIKYKIKEKRKG